MYTHIPRVVWLPTESFDAYHGETNIRSHLDLEESGKPSYILIMEI
jgi:hypothetical protein